MLILIQNATALIRDQARRIAFLEQQLAAARAQAPAQEILLERINEIDEEYRRGYEKLGEVVEWCKEGLCGLKEQESIMDKLKEK